MEFTILLLFIFGVFIIFFVGSFEMEQDVRVQKEETATRHMLIRVREEILLAQESHNGYERTFDLPQKLNGRYDYTISVIGTSLEVKTSEVRRSMPIPTINVTGSGDTWTLEKEDDAISLVKS